MVSLFRPVYRSGFFLLVSLLMWLFFSCDSNRFYDRSLTIDQKGWHEDSLKVFDVDATDTVSAFDFYINVRNTTGYRYSNLYLFLFTRLPDGHTATDTLELTLADNTGRWYGKGSGHLRENSVLIRQGLKFPMKGHYRFTLQQAMREDDNVLEGIKSIGIRIEKENEKRE